MRACVYVFALFIISNMVGCASFSMNSTFDPETDFSRYSSYDWLPKAEKAGMAGVKDPLIGKRVARDIEDEMNKTGFHKNTSGKPDLFVVYHGNVRDRVEVTQWGYSYGRGPYWSKRRLETYRYKQGTLAIDLIDAKTKELVWRGVAITRLEKGGKYDDIDTAVHNILRDFPPKK